MPWPDFHDEAEEEGAIGLLIALEKFETASGAPFCPFARTWVRKEIQRWKNVGVYWRGAEHSVSFGKALQSVDAFLATLSPEDAKSS